MQRSKRELGFTLVEILIVVVIMAVLAAAITPQFTDSSNDAKVSTSKHNLRVLRAQLEVYRSQHNGEYPPTLADMAKKTNADHSATGSPTLGPYCREVPVEPTTNKADVATSTADPIVVTGKTGGWIYNKTTGEIRVNHEDYSSL